MNTTRKLFALTAAGSMLTMSAMTAHAADPETPNSNRPLYQPGMNEPGGAVDSTYGTTHDHDAAAQKDDRGWMEQVRDWWNSDQGEIKSVSGTIVDLETFLINGEEAARQQSSNASLYDSDPVALLTEDGDLYILLDRYEQRMTASHFSANRDRNAAANDPTSLNGANKAGDRNADAFDVDTTDQRSPAARASAGANANAATAQGDTQTHHLTAGKTVTINGNVYDRSGIKGLLVYGYSVDSQFDRAATSQNRDRASWDRTGASDAAHRSPEQRATPRPSDAQRDGDMRTNPSSTTQPAQDRNQPRPSDENATGNDDM